MKKRILGLAIAAAVIISLVASGTWAIFTDTETTTDNTFTAGTIDISLDPTEGQDVVTLEGDLDLKPCQVGYTYINVTNDGTNPADIWKHIANVVNDENEVNEPEQAYYDANPNSVNWLMSNWIHYDMILCEYSEECWDEANFVHVETNEPEYDFDVCRVTDGGMVKWTITLDDATVPSLSASEIQLVIAEDDGATPDFLIGCNCHEKCPLYKPYNGSWGAATDVLPDGMSVTGTCGGSEWVIEIPMSYLSCPDLYWAMSVGADFAGTAGMSTYRFTSNTGWWSTIPFYTDTCNCTEVIAESEGFMLTGPTLPVECSWIYLGLLEPGQSMFVIQSYHLDGTVENWAQSDKVIFDMEFLAQQSEGDPDPPTPELPGHAKPQ